MSIEIPWTRIADLTIRAQLFSGEQEGALGGPSLPIPRMGDRFAVDIQTTQFQQDAVSRRFMAALFEASNSSAKILLNQPNFSGQRFNLAAVVDGDGQGGTTLNVRGMTPGASLHYGQFFSIVHGGVHFNHMVAGQIIVASDGRAALPIWPMLRFLTVDGERCAFVDPMIEGKLVGFDKGVSFSSNRTKPFSFSIVERA